MKTLALPTIVLAAALSMSLSACAPVYHTGYNFLPPADPASQGCVTGCEANRAQCLNNGYSLALASACNATYRSCFTRCGGAIETSTVCVDHCYGEHQQLVMPPAPGTVPVQ